MEGQGHPRQGERAGAVQLRCWSLGGRTRASKAGGEGRSSPAQVLEPGEERRSFKQGGFLVQGVRTQEEGIRSQRDKQSFHAGG